MQASRWRPWWDRWLSDHVGISASELPVLAAEWVAARRSHGPSTALSLLTAASVAVVVALDSLLATQAGTAALWGPVIVLTVLTGSRSATAACILTGVTIGAVTDRTNTATSIMALDAGLRLAGLLAIATLASWAVAATTELARWSRTDPGTGLLNRRGFLFELERERARSLRFGTPLSLVYLDVDGLKTANDRHGHAHGDQLLARFAATLDGARRVVDVAGRLGGDEFVLLLPGADCAGVELVLRRLFSSLRREPGALSASAGAVTWAVPPPAATMVRAADEVMYRMKHRGGRAWTVLDLREQVSPTARTA